MHTPYPPRHSVARSIARMDGCSPDRWPTSTSFELPHTAHRPQVDHPTTRALSPSAWGHFAQHALYDLKRLCRVPFVVLFVRRDVQWPYAQQNILCGIHHCVVQGSFIGDGSLIKDGNLIGDGSLIEGDTDRRFIVDSCDHMPASVHGQGYLALHLRYADPESVT